MTKNTLFSNLKAKLDSNELALRLLKEQLSMEIKPSEEYKNCE